MNAIANIIACNNIRYKHRSKRDLIDIPKTSSLSVEIEPFRAIAEIVL